MSIDNLLNRICEDTAVYWGTSNIIGPGNAMVFAAPIEIKCRWEDMTQLMMDAKGNRMTSRAVVFVLQDVDEEGMLFRGTLEDLYDRLESSAGALDDPQEIDGAYFIKRFVKTPALSSTTSFVRSAYLTPSLSFGGF